MASLSDGMYSTYPQQMRGEPKDALKGPVITASSNTALCPTPEGMEQFSVWSTWRTAGSDRTPSNYPCAHTAAGRPAASCAEPCGKSLILRENSVWGDVVGSADGTGYLTTNWLPPNVPAARLGFGIVSRQVVPIISAISAEEAQRLKPISGPGGCGPTCPPSESPDAWVDEKGKVYLTTGKYGNVSQLFLDGKPLLRYWQGVPFLFQTQQTPFVYMLPNALWVRTGGASYRVDVVASDAQSCGDCIGY